MVTYQERKENAKVYVLIKSGAALGCFGNLKKLCEYVQNEDFPSYWTLVRKKNEVITHGDYLIQKVRYY